MDCLLIPKHSSRKCFVLIAVPAPMVSWITSASPGSCRLHFSRLWWRFLEKMETLETYIVPQDFDGAVEGIALKSSTDGVDRPFPNWSQTTEIRISAQFILVLSAFQVHTVGIRRSRPVQEASLGPGHSFVDVGSGLGKLVVAAACVTPDEVPCYGVEISPFRWGLQTGSKLHSPGGQTIFHGGFHLYF